MASSNLDLKERLDTCFEDTTALDPLCKSISAGKLHFTASYTYIHTYIHMYVHTILSYMYIIIHFLFFKYFLFHFIAKLIIAAQ